MIASASSMTQSIDYGNNDSDDDNDVKKRSTISTATNISMIEKDTILTLTP